MRSGIREPLAAVVTCTSLPAVTGHGDVPAGLAAAAVTVDATYTTPALHNNQCRRNGKSGIYFGQGAGGTAQANVCEENKDSGIAAFETQTAPALRDKGRYWPVPPDAHPKLEQGGVVLEWAQDRQAALALRDFLTGAEGRAVLKRFGFLLPGE